MSRAMAYALGVAGVVAMVAAAAWAPAQPVLWQGGGACEIALCGALEDPPRWRAAWWIWGAGLGALLVAVPMLVRPARLRPRWVFLFLLTAPLWLPGLATIAYLVSHFTSAQGAATVAACGLLAPVVAVLAGAVKSRRPPTA